MRSSSQPNPIEVLVLAGGKATRFPNKLRQPVGDVPMLVRVCRTFSSTYPTYISSSVRDLGSFDALADCTVVADRWPDRGPLGGIVSTMGVMRSPLVFVIAADMPFVDISLIALLRSQFADSQAVVPVHDDGMATRTAPLAALYARVPFLREATVLLRKGQGAIHAALDRLVVRYVPIPKSSMLCNINTPADYTRYCHMQTDR